MIKMDLLFLDEEYTEEEIEALRKQLLDYYGTAMVEGNFAALSDLELIENANDEEIIGLAKKHYMIY